ncbi:DinB family protein [Candidatus Hodarchaeum mangrovi]
MNKQQCIQFYIDNHKKLFNVVNRLKRSQMDENLGSWTVKDILAHISAWNFELINAIDSISNDEKPWFIDEEKLNEREFNKLETQKRRQWTIDEIMEEWQESFDELITKIKDLSSSEWDYQTNFVWKGTSIPVSIPSLLSYTYKGDGHEGGHAVQIENYFKKK